MVKKSVKETIHAKDLDISIYTEDFQNELLNKLAIRQLEAIEKISIDTVKNQKKSNRRSFSTKGIIYTFDIIIVASRHVETFILLERK